MPLVDIEDIADPRIDAYRNVPDPELLRAGGLFVAEGRLVVRRLLTQSRFRTRSVLLTASARRALSDVVDPVAAGLDIFLANLPLMRAITGFDIHRGCLAIGEREPALAVLEITRAARLIVVLEGVGNADNVGGIFRNAAAFGAGGVLLGPDCCDPLYRKAIRVSMGATLSLPFALAGDWLTALDSLRHSGFKLVALTPALDAQDIVSFSRSVGADERVALMIGAEGEGLTPAACVLADVRVRIPIAPDMDSLNAATAAGIALHRIRGWGGLGE